MMGRTLKAKFRPAMTALREYSSQFHAVGFGLGDEVN